MNLINRYLMWRIRRNYVKHNAWLRKSKVVYLDKRVVR